MDVTEYATKGGHPPVSTLKDLDAREAWQGRKPGPQPGLLAKIETPNP